MGEEKKCEKEFGLKEREKIARKKTQNWANERTLCIISGGRKLVVKAELI